MLVLSQWMLLEQEGCTKAQSHSWICLQPPKFPLQCHLPRAAGKRSLDGQGGSLCGGPGAAGQSLPCSPPPSWTSQAVAGAPSTVAHMDPIRAVLISPGSLTPPSPREQPGEDGDGGTRGAQGCGTPHHTGCCLDVTFGLRGAALAVLILPAESKESPFPTANQTCGIWKSLRHNKQGILGCFKCVPVWISA